MLYVNSLNAINWSMKAELLFYNKFFVDLTLIGFKLDQFDTCVSKHLINGK